MKSTPFTFLIVSTMPTRAWRIRMALERRFPRSSSSDAFSHDDALHILSLDRTYTSVVLDGQCPILVADDLQKAILELYDKLPVIIVSKMASFERNIPPHIAPITDHLATRNRLMKLLSKTLEVSATAAGK